MYYRRGPIGLVIISIIVLGLFLELTKVIYIDPIVIILISCIVCPFISKIIYILIKKDK